MGNKILFIVGTNNKNSIINGFLENLTNTFQERQLECSKLFLHSLNIKYCIGCRNCFKRGFCVFDGKDDIELIDQEIKKNDIIVFLSSVYFHNVPGKLKSMVDRLAYKAHLLEYSGKIGFTITNTFSTGSQIVRDFLIKVQTNFGICNINNYLYIEKEFNYNKFIQSTANSILNELNIKVYSNKELEGIFQVYKNGYSEEAIYLYEKLNYVPENEIRFWNQSWIKKTDSFCEFSNRKANNDFEFEDNEIFLKNINKLEVDFEKDCQ